MKKNYRKFLASTVTTAAVVTSTVVPFNVLNVSAAEMQFPDVQQSDYFYEAVESLTSRSLIKGYEDGAFLPNNNVTRAEAAKILALALELNTKNVQNPGFSDVSADHWAYEYISALVEEGILNGIGGGTFKPNDPLTRAQMAKMISLSFNFGEKAENQFSDVKDNDWFSGYVGALVDKEVTTGTTPTTFSPDMATKRGQFAAFVYRSEVASVIQQTQTIENVTNNTVKINGSSYQMDASVKSILNEENRSMLEGAKVIFEKTGDKITSLTYLEITAGGTATNNLVLDGENSVLEGNLKVNADYVSVENLTVTGDLEIGRGFENNFAANQLIVEGKTVVLNEDKAQTLQAAATTSQGSKVIFQNSTLGVVEVNKSDVEVEAKGTTTIEAINISANAVISGDKEVVIPYVTLTDGASDVQLDVAITDLIINIQNETTVTGNSSIEFLTVKNNNQVIVDTNGKISEVVIETQTGKLTLGANVEVDDISFPDEIELNELISNYDEVKKNIDNINGKKNPDATTTGGSSGRRSSGGNNNTPSQPATTTALNLENIVVENSAGTGEDTITVNGLNANDVIRVYTSATGESPIETETATSSSLTIQTEDLLQNGGFVWVTVQQSGKTESDRVKKAYAAENVTVYNTAGTYGPTDGESVETITGDVIIDADDVILQNMKIEGNVIISEAVGEGEATLRNVTVTGNTTVMGGGINSIYFENSVLATVIVNKNNGAIRIVAQGTTEVDEVVLESTVKIEEEGLTGDAAGFTDVTLSDNLQNSNPDLEVELVGQFDTINSRAAQVRMNLPESTNVNQLILNVAASVLGQGRVTSLVVHANGSSIERRPEEVIINIPGDNQGIEIEGDQVTESESSFTQTELSGTTVMPSYIRLDLSRYVSGITLSDLDITATLNDQEIGLDQLNLNYDPNLRVIEYSPLMNDDNAGAELSFTISPKAEPAEGEEDVRKVIGDAKSGSVTLSTGASGQITDVFGTPAINATINFKPTIGNEDSTPVQTVTTDRNGLYSADLEPGTYEAIISGAGYIDTNFIVTVTSDTYNIGQNATAIRAAASNAAKIMLSWNGTESDVDSHMIGPKVDGGEFHTYYGDRVYEEDVRYVDLDWDDTDYYGPETTTVRKWTDGRYVFYVHNFSGYQPLSESDSVVKVYEGNSNHSSNTFDVPENSGTKEYWAVFELFVSDNGETFDYRPIETMISDDSWLSSPVDSLEGIIETAENAIEGEQGFYSGEEIAELIQLVSDAKVVLRNTSSTTKEILEEIEKVNEKLFHNDHWTTENIEYVANGEISDIDPTDVGLGDGYFEVPSNLNFFTFTDGGVGMTATKDDQTREWTFEEAYAEAPSDQQDVNAALDLIPLTIDEIEVEGGDAADTATKAAAVQAYIEGLAGISDLGVTVAVGAGTNSGYKVTITKGTAGTGVVDDVAVTAFIDSSGDQTPITDAEKLAIAEEIIYQFTAWYTDLDTTITTMNTEIGQAELPYGVTAVASAGEGVNVDKVVITITSGNQQETMWIAAPVDHTSPTFVSTPEAVPGTNNGEITLSTNISKSGTVKYVVVANGHTAPTASEIWSGIDFDNTSYVIYHDGYFTQNGNDPSSIVIWGLTSGNSYDIYLVAGLTDSDIHQNDVTKIENIIAGDQTAPTPTTPEAPGGITPSEPSGDGSDSDTKVEDIIAQSISNVSASGFRINFASGTDLSPFETISTLTAYNSSDTVDGTVTWDDESDVATVTFRGSNSLESLQTYTLENGDGISFGQVEFEVPDMSQQSVQIVSATPSIQTELNGRTATITVEIDYTNVLEKAYVTAEIGNPDGASEGIGEAAVTADSGSVTLTEEIDLTSLAEYMDEENKVYIAIGIQDEYNDYGSTWEFVSNYFYTVELDTVAPLITAVDIYDASGTNNGFGSDNGDKMLITFSEPMHDRSDSMSVDDLEGLLSFVDSQSVDGQNVSIELISETELEITIRDASVPVTNVISAGDFVEFGTIVNEDIFEDVAGNNLVGFETERITVGTY